MKVHADFPFRKRSPDKNKGTISKDRPDNQSHVRGSGVGMVVRVVRVRSESIMWVSVLG